MGLPVRDSFLITPYLTLSVFDPFLFCTMFAYFIILPETGSSPHGMLWASFPIPAALGLQSGTDATSLVKIILDLLEYLDD